MTGAAASGDARDKRPKPRGHERQSKPCACATVSAELQRTHAPDDGQERTVGLLLLGKGAVLAHGFERPLAAGLDESEQRSIRGARGCWLLLSTDAGVSARAQLTPARPRRERDRLAIHARARAGLRHSRLPSSSLASASAAATGGRSRLLPFRVGRSRRRWEAAEPGLSSTGDPVCEVGMVSSECCWQLSRYGRSDSDEIR
jgi:hypothetical protein